MSDQRFKVEKGIWVSGPNNIIDQTITMNGNVTVNNSLLLVNGNLVVTGNQIINGITIYNTSLYPTTNGVLNIGSASNTYNLYGNNIQSAITSPYSNGGVLGTSTQRWNTYSTNIDASGTLNVGGNLTVNNTGSVDAFLVDATNFRASVNALTVAGYAFNVGGNAQFSGGVTSNGFTVGVIGSTNGSSITTTSVTTGNSTVSAQITPSAIIFGKAGLYQNVATVTSNTVATIVDAFPNTLSRSAKLLVSVDNSTSSLSLMHVIEMLLIYDNTTNVLVSKYGELYNTRLGTFDANVAGGNINILFTPFTANTYTVKTQRQQILI